MMRNDWFKHFCHDYDTEWPQLVSQSRVKAVRDGVAYKFDSDDGIMKTPFEPFNMTVCMPEDFPRCGSGDPPKDSAHRMTMALPLLLALKLW